MAPAWLVTFLTPLIRLAVQLFMDELRRQSVKEQESTDDPRDAELAARVRDLVGRLPPAAPPGKP